jgi:hypothetical protein
MIPLLLHRIWFGSFLPEAYQGHIVQLVQHNPRCVVVLWADHTTLSIDEQKQFENFCQLNGIVLRNIREHTTLLNFSLIQEELDAMLSDPKNRRIHCVRASDLARVAILLKEGGAYTDTDTESRGGLPELHAPLGLLVKPNRLNEYMAKHSNNDYPEYDQVFNDFLAASPNNPILKFAAEITALDYQTYHNSVHKAWESSTNRKIHLLSTIRLTGSSLRWAINYKIAHGEILPDARANLFFDDADFLDALYDKSWLEGCVDEASEMDDAWQSMLLFREEIDAERNRVFPCYLPEVLKDKLPEFDFPRIDYTPRDFELCDIHALLEQRAREKEHTELLARAVQPIPFGVTDLPKFVPEPFVFQMPEIKVDFPIPKLELSELPCKLLKAFIKKNSSFLDRFTQHGKINQDVEALFESIKDTVFILMDDVIEKLSSIAVRASSSQALELNALIDRLKQRPIGDDVDKPVGHII